MSRSLTFRTLAIGMIAVGAAGCSDLFLPQGSDTLDSAFASVPLGYESAATSFGDAAVGGEEGWGPRRGGHGGPGGPGGMRGKMMGGGLGGPFLGIGFGPGFGRRPFGSAVNGNCTFDSASSRLVCATSSDRGLTVERSIQYKDASGTVQSAFDTLTTNSVNVRASVNGTRTRGDFSTTVEHTSDQTVVGLAPGSTHRTVNGASSGKETTTGTNDTGQFTAVRNVSDKIEGVVIPVSTTAGKPPYPTAGKITRSMEVTLTYAGQSPQTSSRSEVITYDGSAAAKLVITRDGVTQNCTVELPRGRPVCSE
jgi:hypothetical protein